MVIRLLYYLPMERMERIKPKNIERKRPKINLKLWDNAYCLLPLDDWYYTEITVATVVWITTKKTSEWEKIFYEIEMNCVDKCIITIDENNWEASRDEEEFPDGRWHRHIKCCNSKEELLEIYKSEKIKYLKGRIEKHREAIKHAEENIKDFHNRIEQLKNNDFTGMIKESFLDEHL